MTGEPTRHCAHMNDDGTECKAHPQGYSEYCFFHDPLMDPLMKDERAAASRAGGVTSTQRASREQQEASFSTPGGFALEPNSLPE